MCMYSANKELQTNCHSSVRVSSNLLLSESSPTPSTDDILSSQANQDTPLTMISYVEFAQSGLFNQIMHDAVEPQIAACNVRVDHLTEQLDTQPHQIAQLKLDIIIIIINTLAKG